MKKLVLAALVCAAAIGASAQYSINWYTISGGGGVSTGGVYSVTGTIGQPDAGAAMSGGNYTLQGGFWSYIAVVQTPGAPLLSVSRSGASVSISWPDPSTGFTLQQNPDLNPSNWVSGPAPVVVGTNKVVTISPPTGKLFFRLIK